MCLVLGVLALACGGEETAGPAGDSTLGGALTVSGPTVLTQRYDNARTGLNAGESQLAPANVDASTFGKLFSLPVDGYVYAQPLYVGGMTVQGQVHDVLFVATEHDTVYAFDADAPGAPLWTASLTSTAYGAAAGATSVPSSDLSCNDLIPEIGITSTPVIDLSAGTLFVIAKTKEGTAYVQRLHALDITTGLPRANSPTVIQASVRGTASDGSGGMVSFNPKMHLNRPGLLLLNGVVYGSWASHCDHTPYHGWLIGYDATTLAQVGAWNTTPDGTMAGIWMSGAGLAADANGHAFVATGNGTFDGTRDFGDSVVKLALANLNPTNTGSGNVACALGTAGCPLVDYFTPFNQATLAANDQDLGSGGVLLLPDQAGNHPHVLVEGGKQGTVYVVDRDNLGHFNSTSNSQIVQSLTGPGALYSTPAYFNNRVYFQGVSNPLKAYGLVFDGTTTLLTTTPVASSASSNGGFPGSSPVVSANGTSGGIVWTIESDSYASSGPAILHAFDATSLAELYNSSQNLARDNPGAAVKFTVPVVVNGRVYVGTATQVSVYGVLGPTTATPTFTPPPGTYASTQSVQLNDATPNAVIYYTTDGTTPTQSSTQYQGPITVSTTTTIKAMAVAPGYAQSAVATGTYVIGTTSVNYGSGFSATGLTLNGRATLNGTRLRLTDGGTGEASSAYYTTLVNVQSFTADFTFQLSSGASIADGFTFVVQNAGLSALGPSGGGLAYGPAAPGGTPGIGRSAAVKFDLYDNAGEGTNSTGLYTNGASPTVPAVTLGNGIDLHSGHVFAAHLVYDGTRLTSTLTDTSTNATFTTSFTVDIPTVVGGTTAYVGFTGATGGLTAVQEILTWTYVSQQQTPTTATPTFTPLPGTYASTQSVQLSDATPNAVIYYTTDGTTPTLSSTQYTQPITVSTTTTIKAMAVAPGYAQSAVATGNYVIATASVNYGSGFSATGLTMNGRATLNGTRLRLTDGGTGEASSAYYTTLVNVQAFTADFTFQLSSGASIADGFTFVIQNSGLTALGPNGGGLAYGPAAPGGTPGIGRSVAVKFDLYNNAGEGTNSTGLYTDGASPTVPAVTLGNGIDLHSGHVLSAHLVYDGTTLTLTLTDTSTNASFTTPFTVDIPTVVGGATAYVGFTGATGGVTAVQEILTWTYAGQQSTPTTATPTFTPSPGTYATTQSVQLSDATPNAVIYYTTDGTTPSQSSTQYTQPITVSTTTTIKAMAVAPGYAQSAVATGTYTIQGSTTATPTFTPPPGRYKSTQSVQLSDATPGAIIYYTTDGTTPPQSSSTKQYTQPITVSTTTTINAMAVATGYAQSAVATGTYKITGKPL